MPQRKIMDLDIKINGTSIDRVRCFNFLGITLNENLTWNDHINKISNKISRNIGILNNLKNLLPEKPKLHIYNSLVLSHLNFGILLWGHKCERVLKLQKKAVRIVKNVKFNAHTEPIFKNLNLLRIDDILKLQELKFYFKSRNNLLPFYLQNIPLLHINEIHYHNTRGYREMRYPLIKHEYARKYIRYSIPETVNQTPACILNKIVTHSLQGFSKYIKTHFVNAYQKDCKKGKKEECYVCSTR